MELDQLSTDFGGHDTKGRGKPGLEFLDLIYPLTEKKKKKNGVVFACCVVL